MNILDTFLIVMSILRGELMHSFEYVVKGRKRSGLYYLVDGIYPPGAIFINKISEGRARKETEFAKAQEALCKDVERAFGVLVSLWGLIAKATKLMDHSLAVNVMDAAIILPT